MAAPAITNLISYEIYGFEKAWILVSDGDPTTPAIVAVPIDKPNKATPEFDNTTVQFEGGNTVDKVYMTTGMTLTFDGDAISADALGGVFVDVAVTASLPAGQARRYYGGTSAQNTGVAAGFRGQADANKRIDGALVGVVKVQVEVPAGTLTRANGVELNTAGKAAAQQLKLSAQKTTKSIIGAALPGVDTDGAFWMLNELS